MKFMKLGSKPDSFQTDGNNARYVATELATDFVINVGDVKFHLHKFPLLSKCSRLHKLVATTSEENDDEIHIPDIPGGPSAFEICAKFCYGMTVTLNAYNVVAARCAAEYLEMQESVEKGNLIYKIEVFLNSGILRSWKDSIIVLQTTKPLLQWCEDLKIVGRCIDSIAFRASIDVSKVEWSYTYNRKKLTSEISVEPHWDDVRKQPVVPNDWWVEDLCDLKIDFYNRVIMAIKTKDRISNEVIGEALQAYALRWIPGFSKGAIQGGDILKNRFLVETLVWLLPKTKGSVSCKFLLKLLKAATLLDSSDMVMKELVKRAGQQLDKASVKDLLIPASAADPVMYDFNMVESMLEEFVLQGLKDPMIGGELHDIGSQLVVSDASKLAVAKLVDGYLAEVSKDPNFPTSKFIDLSEKVGSNSRPDHDGLYRAIDTYLKEHPGLSKAEKRRICQLMDCKKLSVDACMHAAQNERLPLRVVVQVLFFEQVRAAAASTGNVADLPMSIRALLPSENSRSHGSSRSATTNTEDDWEASAADLKTLKGELASMRLSTESNDKDVTKSSNGNVSGKAKGVGIFKSKKILKKILSNKPGQGENSSDTSDSPGSGSANQEDNKYTPSRNRRFSVS